MSIDPRRLVLTEPEVRVPHQIGARLAYHVRRSGKYRRGWDPDLDSWLAAFDLASDRARKNGTHEGRKTEQPQELETMSTQQAADYLGCGTRWVAKLAARGRLERPGRGRVTRASVIAEAEDGK